MKKNREIWGKMEKNRYVFGKKREKERRILTAENAEIAEECSH